MSRKSMYGTFVEGMRNGWTLGTMQLLPNMVMAFALIQILNKIGLLEILGKVFGPLMGFFGLPGEAVTVLLTAWLSAGGGVGAAAGLYTHGTLNGTHVSILIPAIFLMGAQLQYVGRILSVAGINPRHYKMLMLIGLLNALLSMLIMRWLVL